MHRLQVPDLADDRPRGHHHHQVGEVAVSRAVPEGVAKDRVVLDGDRIDHVGGLERALLEHHDRRVVDAGALRKDEHGQFVLVGDVLAQLSRDAESVGRLTALEEHVMCGLVEDLLEEAEEALVHLADQCVRVVAVQHEYVDR